MKVRPGLTGRSTKKPLWVCEWTVNRGLKNCHNKHPSFMNPIRLPPVSVRFVAQTCFCSWWSNKYVWSINKTKNSPPLQGCVTYKSMCSRKYGSWRQGRSSKDKGVYCKVTCKCILNKACRNLTESRSRISHAQGTSDWTKASTTLCRINLKTQLWERKRNKCFASTHENGTNVLRPH